MSSKKDVFVIENWDSYNILCAITALKNVFFIEPARIYRNGRSFKSVCSHFNLSIPSYPIQASGEPII